MSTMTSPSPQLKPVDDHLTGHEYDGISEYDNPTPGWWHVIFLMSIIFAAVYALFWHTSSLAWTEQEAWQSNQLAEYQRLFADVGDLKGDEGDILKMMGNQKLLSVAEATFQGTCSSCHAKDGGGLVGPNLCDDLYKNVKTLPDIFNVITNGAGNGAMPSWRGNYSQNERVLLAAYVANLRGTKPASPKPVTKEEAAIYVAIPPWPARPVQPAGTTPAEPASKN